MDAYDIVIQRDTHADKLDMLTRWLEVSTVALETIDILAHYEYPCGMPCQAFDGLKYRRRWYGKQYIDIAPENRVLWLLNPDLSPIIHLRNCPASEIYLGDTGDLYLYTGGLGYGTIAVTAFESLDDFDTIIKCLRDLQKRVKASTL